MQAVALTTREHATLLLLIGTTEVKTTQVCTHVNILATHADGLVATTHHLIDGLIGQDILA